MLVEDRGALTLLKPYRVRRREPRYVSIPVTMQRFLRFGPFITRGVSLDISTQGMSALVCGAPRVGETAVIELPLRDARIDMLATVRHSTDSKSGFEFYPLSASAQFVFWREQNRHRLIINRSVATQAAVDVLECSTKYDV